MRYFVIILVLFGLTPFAKANPIVADLGVYSVDINHDFTGRDVLMIGARNDIGKIVILLRGEKKNYIVRKKEKIAGIWTNKKSVEFKDVVNFYSAFASSADRSGAIKPSSIADKDLLKNLSIGVDNIEFVTKEKNLDIAEDFRKAFINKKQQANLYQIEIGGVDFQADILFRVNLVFPKNVETGKYTAEVYLINDNQISAMHIIPVVVKKIGFDSFVYNLAHKYKIIYGSLCILIAISLGFFANRFFKKYR